MIRYNWQSSQIKEIYLQPFINLVYQAQTVHREFFPPNKVQISSLISLKTGGCSEDCAYCAQSAHHKTEIEAKPLLDKNYVLKQAEDLKAKGTTRLCMGTAWKCIRNEHDFDKILEIVSAVSQFGMEVCCTLGMLTLEQAQRLKEAGCDYYNHNIDTAPSYYPKIVTTHTFNDRLETIKNVRQVGIKLCCGGIIGMGESQDERIEMLRALANQDPHPESVPVNMLVPIPGTPLEKQERIDSLELVRTIATARLVMPTSFVRLSAGREQMSDELQALCFLAGANSIHSGEKLLTAKNQSPAKDQELFNRLGLGYFTREELKK